MPYRVRVWLALVEAGSFAPGRGKFRRTAHARGTQHLGSDGGDAGGFKPRNPEVDFRGERPSNQTHRSSTDPQPGCTASRAATRRCSATWVM